MSFSAADRAAMAQALRLAERGLYSATPNPRVGCVLTKDDVVVGEGWHRRAGEPHAEIHALLLAGGKAQGATAHVTLEPCSHQGRTPPCADALIAAGVRRVVAAMEDPDPRVSGRGLARLRAAGVAVETGLLEEAARELNIGFIARMTRGRPWLRLKIAASLDGRTALNNGESQWITNTMARRDGHRWRARACAILTGMGTVREDDPNLDVRDVETDRQPVKIVLDPRLELSPQARLFASGAPLLVVSAVDDRARAAPLLEKGAEWLCLPDANGQIDLPALMRELAARDMNEVHGEAGARLNGAFIAAGLADELLLYLAPCLLGDAARPLMVLPEPATLATRTRLAFHDVKPLGNDLRLLARFAGERQAGLMDNASRTAGGGFAPERLTRRSA
ncbi:MAG: bifunctional diaminohydroxyphosphoribosylaminopyrimidine deaminase/5-amino-6-(5-phosphoribosylamino)uracil reductase RibD [Zoogloeaceae bacterium]|jgi:diaminohydroxyphosphoribosylaminopyrimidine deaminase/5-amino-6-(5-phosphoribosylamino)uracil reductase|nr:bifunctional diaminohydroxyphosphoribosylaminopyrimidine deaminase/5-amino-6-(5-phosphoribosylamino)uracil reductase RibD [Zoogloeaceae bacterium]